MWHTFCTGTSRQNSEQTDSAADPSVSEGPSTMPTTETSSHQTTQDELVTYLEWHLSLHLLSSPPPSPSLSQCDIRISWHRIHFAGGEPVCGIEADRSWETRPTAAVRWGATREQKTIQSADVTKGATVRPSPHLSWAVRVTAVRSHQSTGALSQPITSALCPPTDVLSWICFHDDRISTRWWWGTEQSWPIAVRSWSMRTCSYRQRARRLTSTSSSTTSRDP